MLICLLAGAATTVIAAVAARSQATVEVVDRLEAHEKLLAYVLERQGAWLATVGAVLSGDARMRTTLGMREIDEETINDILSDLARGNELRVLAALDDRGRVRAVIGADALRGTELGAASVVAKALESRLLARDIWTLDARPFNVAVVPVRVGPDTNAYLLLGHPLEGEVIDAIAGTTDHAGVIVGGRIAYRTVAADIADEDLVRASTRQPEARFVSRIQTLSQGSSPINVTWLSLRPGLFGAVARSAHAMVVGTLAALVIFFVTRERRKLG